MRKVPPGIADRLFDICRTVTIGDVGVKFGSRVHRHQSVTSQLTIDLPPTVGESDTAIGPVVQYEPKTLLGSGPIFVHSFCCPHYRNSLAVCRPAGRAARLLSKILH